MHKKHMHLTFSKPLGSKDQKEALDTSPSLSPEDPNLFCFIIKSDSKPGLESNFFFSGGLPLKMGIWQTSVLHAFHKS